MEHVLRWLKMDKSSFLYWYPKILGKLETPRSVIIPFSTQNAVQILSGNEDALSDLVDTVISELRKNHISFPVFFKTDFYSAKWYWVDTCFINSKNDLEKNIASLLSSNQDDDCRPINALIFKQYIQPETKLSAFNNMPIGKERRYFIENKRVLCHHPYWEENSLEFFNKDYPEDWKDILHDLNAEDDSEIETLTRKSELFARLIDDDGYFSIDFMQGIAGNWYVIDCAEGHKSYHNEDCPVFLDKQ